MKILITAFDAFDNRNTNISELVLNELNTNIDNHQIIKRIIPTTFSKTTITNLLDEISPDILLLLGEASSRDKIALEKVAINHVDAKIPDNLNVSLKDQLILNNSDLAYFSTFNIKKIIDKLQSNNIYISYSAGTFVCNYTYYIALNYIKQNNLNTKTLFIHLPLSNIDVLKNTIEKILQIEINN